MKMIPTFVTKLPTGAENSLIYALDIGGSNLRVIRTNFTGDGQVDQEKVVKKSIPQHIQTGMLKSFFWFLSSTFGELD
jgi:hexokinase